MKKIITTLIFIMSMIFIGTYKVDAASSVDFYTECNYKYTLNADQSKTGDNITLYYSGMNDSDGDEIGLVAFGTEYGYVMDYSYTNEGFFTFGTEDYTGTWFKFSNGETSSPITSFKSNYTATGQCPKYLYAEFTSESWGKKYYKMMFSNTKPDICVAGDAKCKILGESSGTVKKITYYEGEELWEETYSGKNTCDNLHVKIYIAGKQFKTDYENALGSSYTSLAVTGEAVKNVDFGDIYNIVNGNNPDIYINPKEGGGGQKQGVSFGTPMGDTYCHITDGMPTLTKSCSTYDSLSSTISSKMDIAFASSKSIDDVAAKYLSTNPQNGSYSVKSYSTEKDATKLANIATEINTALTTSTFLTTSTEYINYLTGLSTDDTLCQEAKEKVLSMIDTYTDYNTNRADVIDKLKETLSNIKSRLESMKETDKADAIDDYIENADALAAEIKTVSVQARNSYLNGTDFKIGDIEGATCNIISADLQKFLQTIIDYIRIAGITLAVVLGILDYIKVIFGSDDKSMAKANKNFATRLIAVALLFLIPAVLNFVLGLFNILGTGDAGTCGIK